MSQMPEMQKNIVSSRNLLLVGAKFGFLGSIWGSLLFSTFYFVLPFVFESPEQISIEWAKDLFGFYRFAFFITFFVSVIPAILAGMTNAWIVDSLASIENLSRRNSVITGIIIGCLFCLIPAWLGAKMLSLLILNNPPSRVEEVRDMITIVIISMVTAALVGSWHSLKMYRFLATPS